MYICIYMCNTLTLQILECTYNCHTCTYHVFILVQVYACVYESVVEVQSVARSLQAKNKAYTGMKGGGGFSNTHTHTFSIICHISFPAIYYTNYCSRVNTKRRPRAFFTHL